MPDTSAITYDTLLRGRVKLLQPRDGYRSSLDPVLLAGFIAPPFGHFLDIGCGTGALSFLLLAHDPHATGVGVELQARLAELAARGAVENAVTERWRLVAGDARRPDLIEAASFDLVATNPPFRALGSGVLPPETEKAVAHHEVSLSLSEWLQVAARALRPGGRLATIFPYDRWDDLRAGLDGCGLPAVRFRPVVPRAGGVPGRILVEARRGHQQSHAEPPLVVHDAGAYTAEVKRMLGEEA